MSFLLVLCGLFVHKQRWVNIGELYSENFFRNLTEPRVLNYAFKLSEIPC